MERFQPKFFTETVDAAERPCVRLHWYEAWELNLSKLLDKGPVVLLGNERPLWEDWKSDLGKMNVSTGDISNLDAANVVWMESLYEDTKQSGYLPFGIQIWVEEHDGQAEWVVKRPNTDSYTRLNQTSDNAQKSKELLALGCTNVEDLKDVSTGIDGIMDNNDVLHTFRGEDVIKVPVDGRVRFVEGAHKSRRGILELFAVKTPNGELRVRWVSGIEPLEPVTVTSHDGLTSSVVFVTQFEKNRVLKEEAVRVKARADLAQEAKLKKELSREAKIAGLNPPGYEAYF